MISNRRFNPTAVLWPGGTAFAGLLLLNRQVAEIRMNVIFDQALTWPKTLSWLQNAVVGNNVVSVGLFCGPRLDKHDPSTCEQVSYRRQGRQSLFAHDPGQPGLTLLLLPGALLTIITAGQS